MKVLVAAVLFVLTMSACVGDDGEGESMTLEAYFTELERVAADYESKANDLVEPPEDASLQEFQDIYSQSFIQIDRDFSAFQNALNELEPPVEAADAHADLLAGLESGSDALREGADHIAEATSREELFSEMAEDQRTYEEVGARLEQVCNDLEAIAEDNAIDVDLECDESE